MGQEITCLQIPITFGSITATSYTIEIRGPKPEIIPPADKRTPLVKTSAHGGEYFIKINYTSRLQGRQALLLSTSLYGFIHFQRRQVVSVSVSVSACMKADSENLMNRSPVTCLPGTMKILPNKLQRLLSKLNFTGKDEQRKLIGTAQKNTNCGSLECGALFPPSVSKRA